jgi:hypothetical protein
MQKYSILRMIKQACFWPETDGIGTQAPKRPKLSDYELDRLEWVAKLQSADLRDALSRSRVTSMHDLPVHHATMGLVNAALDSASDLNAIHIRPFRSPPHESTLFMAITEFLFKVSPVTTCRCNGPSHCTPFCDSINEVCEKLTRVVRSGAVNVDVRDDEGLTPLHFAVMLAGTRSGEAAFQLSHAIMEQTSNIDARDMHDQTALMLLAMSSEALTTHLDAFIKYGANMNQTWGCHLVGHGIRRGDTMLHILVRNEHADVLRHLLEKDLVGFDWTIPNRDGQTFTQLAVCLYVDNHENSYSGPSQTQRRIVNLCGDWHDRWIGFTRSRLKEQGHAAFNEKGVQDIILKYLTGAGVPFTSRQEDEDRERSLRELEEFLDDNPPSSDVLTNAAILVGADIHSHEGEEADAHSDDEDNDEDIAAANPSEPVDDDDNDDAADNNDDDDEV